MQKSSAPLFVVIIVCLFASIYGSNRLFEKVKSVSPSELHRPTMFFAGMDKFLSQVNWMALIQWQASHVDLNDATSELLYRKFNALTNLDPLFSEGYLMGALSLAPHKPKYANELIKKAMLMGLNKEWKVPFYGGFICMVYLHDYPQAEEYFTKAAAIVDCPSHIKRELVRSKCLQHPGDKLYALRLWSDYYKNLSEEERKKQTTVSYEILTTGQEYVDDCNAKLQSETQEAQRTELAKTRDEAVAIMGQMSTDEVKKVKELNTP